jgi:hypothetical protein
MIKINDIKELGKFIFLSNKFWRFVFVLVIIIFALTVSFGIDESGKFYFKVTSISEMIWSLLRK